MRAYKSQCPSLCNALTYFNFLIFTELIVYFTSSEKKVGSLDHPALCMSLCPPVHLLTQNSYYHEAIQNVMSLNDIPTSSVRPVTIPLRTREF
jgi:hypothetical protein